MNIEGARGILFTITGGANLGMTEVNEAAKIITASAEDDAKIIFGAVIDPKMKDEIKLTVVATGFDGHLAGARASAETDRQYTPSAYIAEKDTKEIERINEEKQKKETVRSSKVSPLKAAQAEPARKKEAPSENEDEDEELGIPAFIRKKMM
jgi:cell division protein FtsZ